MNYRVELQRTEEGYAVWCPELPGCWSQGATEEEALGNFKDAVEMYLAAKELLPDYAIGGELTTFTALDREDFLG